MANNFISKVMVVLSTKLKLLKRLLQGGSEQQILNAIDKVHPADIARLFSDLSDIEIRRLVDCLFQKKKAGLVLNELPEHFLPQILGTLDFEKLAIIISRQETDDAFYLLSLLPEGQWSEILNLLPPEKRAHLEKLLLYPEHSAGTVMSLDYFSVSLEDTVEEALKKLREFHGKESIFYIYVLEDKKLVGVVPLRSLVLSDLKRPVREVMNTSVKTVLATVNQEEAAQMVGKYNLLAIPVVNEHQELLGTITVDDVIDIFQEEATEDIYHMAGLSEEDRAFTPIRTKVKKRLPWMLINLGTALLASFVIGLFESTIGRSAILAAFMTIVASMGGNGGIQSLVVMTRSIALGELEFSKAYMAILKEIMNGVIVGLVAGVLAGGFAYFYQGNVYFGIILFAAMVTNMILAGLAGAAVPIVFKWLKLDPAVGSGVIVTTITDVGGFFVFLGLACYYIDKLV